MSDDVCGKAYNVVWVSECAFLIAFADYLDFARIQVEQPGNVGYEQTNLMRDYSSIYTEIIDPVN